MNRSRANPDAAPKRPKTREEEREALLAYAFRVLGARAVTASELRRKLEHRSDDPELCEEVLVRVQELGYQNDAEVARSEGKRSGVGSIRVRQTLKRRGVDEELIAETLQERDPDDEHAEALRLLERRWPALSRKKQPTASAYAFLARRGFSGRVIWPVLREVMDAQVEEIAEGEALEEEE